MFAPLLERMDLSKIISVTGKSGLFRVVAPGRQAIIAESLEDGKRLDGTTPHFERVYGEMGPPQDSHYSGHVNENIAV